MQQAPAAGDADAPPPAYAPPAYVADAAFRALPAALAYTGGPDARSGGAAVPTVLDATLPAAKYQSRGTVPKAACHWGQRKLLISEMQLLTYYCEPNTPYWIVYVGAAPGSHLMFLDRIYRGLHHWELVDPGQFDHRYATLEPAQRARFTLRSEFFDNAAAYRLAQMRLRRARCPALSACYGDVFAAGLDPTAKVTAGDDADAARTADIPIRYEPPLEPAQRGLALLLGVAGGRCKMLFVSDVRSGSDRVASTDKPVGGQDKPSAKVDEKPKPKDMLQFEHHVFENMRAQQAWSDIVNATFAMLKFRLPFSFIQKYDHNLRRTVQTPTDLPRLVPLRRGELLLPVWTRPTSTECRHVIPENSPLVTYDSVAYEDQLFFFNAVLRESVHFPHALHGDEWVDHRFDGAAEVAVLSKFVRGWRAVDGRVCAVPAAEDAAVLAEVRALSDDVSTAIGSSFERAFQNRERIHVDKAQRAGWVDATRQRLDAARQRRAEPLWHRALTPAEAAGAAAQPPSARVGACAPLLPDDAAAPADKKHRTE